MEPLLTHSFNSSQAAAIQKYVYVAIFCFVLAFGYKMTFSIPGFFQGDVYDYPLCENSMFSIVSVMYLLIQVRYFS